MRYSPYFKLDYPSFPPNRVFFKYAPDNVGLMVAVFKDTSLENLTTTYQRNIHQDDLEGAIQQKVFQFKGNPAVAFFFNVTASYKNNLASDPSIPPTHLSDFVVLTSDGKNNSFMLTNFLV
jgi:hypothetical protein